MRSRLRLKETQSIRPCLVLVFQRQASSGLSGFEGAVFGRPSGTRGYSYFYSALCGAGKAGPVYKEVRSCFERARLQLCRKRLKMSWTLAPGGGCIHEFSAFAGLGK
jgi:hypothetical protein